MREGWDIPLDGCCSSYSLSEIKYKIKERGEAATVAVVLRCCCCCCRHRRCCCCWSPPLLLPSSSSLPLLPSPPLLPLLLLLLPLLPVTAAPAAAVLRSPFGFASRRPPGSHAPASSHSHSLPPLVLLQPPLGLGFLPNSTRHWPGES